MSEPIYIIVKKGLVDHVVGNNDFRTVDFDALESWCCPFCHYELPIDHPESFCSICTFDWTLGDSDYDLEYLHNCYNAMNQHITLAVNGR